MFVICLNIKCQNLEDFTTVKDLNVLLEAKLHTLITRFIFLNYQIGYRVKLLLYCTDRKFLGAKAPLGLLQVTK